MLHTWLPDNTIKLRFRDIFDDLGVAVLTHDENSKTLRLGPGYSILDENGSALGAGGGGGLSGSGVANQIALWTDTDELGGDSGFTFDPTATLHTAFFDLRNSAQAVDATNSGVQIVLTPATVESSGSGIIGLNVRADTALVGAMYNTIGAYVTATATNGTVVQEVVGADIQVSADAMAVAAIGLRIEDVSGAGTTNQAIKTGAGDIVFGTLAGIGTRTVVVDANGKLSAP